MNFFKKRKKSLVYLILVTFLFGYITWTYQFKIYNMEKFAARNIESRVKKLDIAVELAKPFLMKNNVKNMGPTFLEVREKKLIDFYIVSKMNTANEREVLLFGNANNELNAINWNYDQLDQVIEDTNVAFKTVYLNDYYFTIGINKRAGDLLDEQLAQTKLAFFQDSFVVSVLLLAIVLLFLKDILQLTKALRKKEDLLKSGFSSLSAEGQILLTAAKTFTESEIDLKETNQHYSEVIAPALMTEIKNKTPTSSILASTLIRVDLNGYTQLFLDRKETNITEILNFYIWRAREVIERYNGLIYQIIGDEIVFHIKDSDQYDSELMALFCLRHFFDITDEVQEKFFKDQQTIFKVKASFVHGQLKFVQLDDSYALSGMPLIESVRMIGAFDERKANSITCVKSLADKYFTLFETDTTVQKQFKGFENKTEVALIKNFKPEHQILQFFSKCSFAKYARKDSDLIKTFHVLEHVIRESNKEHFAAIAWELRQIKLKKVSDRLVTAYTDLIELALDQLVAHPMKKDYLSTLISLSYNLIPTESFTGQLKSLFLKSLKIADPRTQANVLSALEEFDPSSQLYKDYIGSESNRLAANALLVDAKKDLNKKARNQIVSFLKNQNPFFNASGLWVVEQAALYHKSNNLIYFKSNPYFEDFQGHVQKFLKNENEMVRKRAESAYLALSLEDEKRKAA